jgi:hypothetical protein
MSKHEGLPVHGYRPQTQQAVNRVNNSKEIEEMVLKFLDELAKAGPTDIDGRWLAIGRTHIEQGFMAVNRSVFRPERAKL